MHRDLKPENIVFTDQAKTNIKIIDFGLSSNTHNSKYFKNTMHVGSPYYMSPEMIGAQYYSEKSDMWSLGMVLFYMVTKTRPFEGDNLEELFVKIVNDLIVYDSKFFNILYLYLTKILILYIYN